ncbi:recombinase family protein [Pseudalkalibacillus sp. SCS-8]|uniref:recombinase family protein n=1 Tax=Pseudalkalibacillus nanhaiensis TaxID=3115291 RepID=UPI0032DA9C2E
MSSTGQNLEGQIAQLKDNGCETIFQEKISGKSANNRQQFQKLIDQVEKDDAIVVTKLDRFARSTRDALNIIEILNQKEVGLVVLNMGGDTLDTTTPLGRLMLTVLSGIAEFELGLNKERQAEGIAEAKKRGAYKGRPKKYTNKNKSLLHAVQLFEERNQNCMTVQEICDITKVGRSTLYKFIKENFKNERQTS